jgi:hypothetical protein
MFDKFGRLQDIVDIILCMTFGFPKSTVLYLHQKGSRLFVGVNFTNHPQFRNNSAFPFKYFTVCVCVCVCVCVYIYIYI